MKQALKYFTRAFGAAPSVGLGALMLTLVASVATTGCGLGFASRPAKVAVRPSADEELAEQRLLTQPFALAMPEDAIVRVVGPSMTCTGTVIEDDLILTAHHCLVERGPRGEYSKKLLEPSQIKIELGGDYFAWGEVSTRAIVAPPCGEGGGAGDWRRGEPRRLRSLRALAGRNSPQGANRRLHSRAHERDDAPRCVGVPR